MRCVNLQGTYYVVFICAKIRYLSFISKLKPHLIIQFHKKNARFQEQAAIFFLQM